MKFWHRNDGKYRGRYAAYTLWFYLTTEPWRWTGSNASYQRDGFHNWEEDKLDVSHLNDWYYIAFSSQNRDWASDDTNANLGNPLTFEWQRYNLAYQALQSFKRYEYNFDTSTGTAMQIVFDDGEYDYATGGVRLETTKEERVTGFYANTNERIHIVVDNDVKNKSNGITFDGVYFYAKDSASMFNNGNWNTSKSLFMSANELGYSTTNGGFIPNQAFLKRLHYAFGNNADIKIMPKFSQPSVIVNIHNTEVGKTYSDKNRGTYIANMVAKSNEIDWDTNGKYHQYSFPKNSVLKVRMIPNKGRAPLNFNVQSHNTGVMSQLKDEKAPSTLRLILNGNKSIYPITKMQDFSIELNPASDTKPPAIVGEDGTSTSLLKSYKGLVNERPALGNLATTMLSSDAKGNIIKLNASAGEHWSFFAVPPQGYYTEWVNGMGDLNKNGMIDNAEINANTDIGDAVGLYAPLYGNFVAGTVLQDNMKYYFRFKPNVVTGGIDRVGTAYQDSRSFYDITKNVTSSSKLRKPVDGAFVQFSDASNTTNNKGEFKLNIKIHRQMDL